MDIDSVVSRLSKEKELNVNQTRNLKTVLQYVYKDGANKFLDKKLFVSSELSSIPPNILTNDRVLNHFVKTLSISSTERVIRILKNSQINHDKLIKVVVNVNRLVVL